MMEKYRVIETKNKADYEYVLMSPSGEELSGGDGLHNQTKLQIHADLLNKETEWLFAEIEELKLFLSEHDRDLRKLNDIATRLGHGNLIDLTIQVVGQQDKRIAELEAALGEIKALSVITRREMRITQLADHFAKAISIAEKALSKGEADG